MIGVWGIETWLRIGGPPQFSVVELGPGRGTLAKDVLRVKIHTGLIKTVIIIILCAFSVCNLALKRLA